MDREVEHCECACELRSVDSMHLCSSQTVLRVSTLSPLSLHSFLGAVGDTTRPLSFVRGLTDGLHLPSAILPARFSPFKLIDRSIYRPTSRGID